MAIFLRRKIDVNSLVYKRLKSESRYASYARYASPPSFSSGPRNRCPSRRAIEQKRTKETKGAAEPKRPTSFVVFVPFCQQSCSAPARASWLLTPGFWLLVRRPGLGG